MPNNTWMPPRFSNLRAAVLSKPTEARLRGYDIRSTMSGADFVYGLGKSASKHKQAKAIQAVDYSDYVETTKTYYTAQIRLMAAFIAFEAYARLRKQKWYELADRAAPNFREAASEVRSKLSASLANELANFMSSSSLQQRIRDFSTGKNEEVFAIANGLRNGFAHGLYGSRGTFAPAAKILREALLMAIDDDIELEIITLR